MADVPETTAGKLVRYDERALGLVIRAIEALPEYRIDNKPLIAIHDAICNLHYGWVGAEQEEKSNG